jgi:predicted Zn-dependent protease with MMP-like domain
MGIMEITEFERLVFKAVDELPEEFREKLDNVDILVEDLPSRQQIDRLRLRSPLQLLGLYEGVPAIKRGSGYSMVPPDKITLFKKSIENKCRVSGDIETEIGKVLRHEIAHHFGFDERTLRRIEREKGIN